MVPGSQKILEDMLFNTIFQLKKTKCCNLHYTTDSPLEFVLNIKSV